MHTSEAKKASRLSKAHVARLLQESHFAHATSHMNPIAKAFLELYLNIAKSVEIFSEYVETLVAASQSEHCTHISETSIAKLAVVADAINEMHEDCDKAKKDLWLLVGHASAGNHLHKLFYQDESMEVLDLKVDDPRIEKLAREVDAGKKAAATAKAKATANANAPRGRGAPRVATALPRVITTLTATITPTEDSTNTITFVSLTTIVIVAVVAADLVLVIPMEIIKIIKPGSFLRMV